MTLFENYDPEEELDFESRDSGIDRDHPVYSYQQSTLDQRCNGIETKQEKGIKQTRHGIRSRVLTFG
jgi:hypothetical protein